MSTWPVPRISRKCDYALRAVFELALRDSAAPVKVREIAHAQDIPERFLEVILGDLRQGGFVESKRGSKGGYVLARPAYTITVAEVIGCLQGSTRRGARAEGETDDVFSNIWERASKAVAKIYDVITFEQLVVKELTRRKAYVPNYTI